MSIEIRELVYIDPNTKEEIKTEIQYDTAQDAVIVDLKKPITFGSEEINQIVIQEPDMSQLKSINITKDGIPFKDVIALGIKLSGLDTARVDKLKGSDCKAFVAGTSYFLQQCLGK